VAARGPSTCVGSSELPLAGPPSNTYDLGGMSKGLGIVQRFVLAYLRYESRPVGLDELLLVWLVTRYSTNDPEQEAVPLPGEVPADEWETRLDEAWFPWDLDRGSWTTEYESLRRAAHGLVKRGLARRRYRQEVVPTVRWTRGGGRQSEEQRRVVRFSYASSA
jgi:hypothetical protein